MRQAHVLSRQSADQKEPHANRGGLQPARGAWRFRIDRASSWHRSLVRGLPRDLRPAAFSAEAGALKRPAAMAALMSSLANGPGERLGCHDQSGLSYAEAPRTVARQIATESITNSGWRWHAAMLA